MSFYIRNALGFLIQFYPCAILCFLPFPEDSYRFRRRYVFTGLTLGSAIPVLIYPVLLRRMISAGIDALFWATTFFHSFVLLGLAAYIWLIRDAVIKKLLVFFIVLFYAATQYWLVNLCTYFIQISPLETTGLYSSGTLMLYSVTTAVLVPSMMGAVISPLRDFIREIESKQMRQEFRFVLISLMVYFVIMICFSNIWGIHSGNWEIYSDKSTWLLSSILFLCLMLNQGMIFWMVFRESVRRKRDSERQRFLEVQRLQYEKIAGEMERTSRLRHDLRHHLNTLGALNAQGRQEEITEYLGQYGAVYDRLGRRNICADPVVDGVLEYYLALARAAEVSVEHRISLKASTGVESADMTVLLGNCLENALEALRQRPVGQRRLSIDMINADAAIILCIKNTCKGKSGSREPTGWEEFVSTKGADRRGVGLRSVTAIAEKYDGSAQFQCKDGVFTTRIILNPTQTAIKD